MSEIIYVFTLATLFGTIITVFALRYATAAKLAKASHGNDDAYRQLAARAIDVQAEHASALAAIHATLAELRSRVAGLEKVLREVE